ncbi:hypothetical protein AB0D08_00370 [Kitasatospora sp. NPDC048540]|uniref:hypothetical protein n=1 Tax=Kitasatospora sp. NPDC048540 TaxID=3155634 RepID=UPI00340C13B3
MTTTTTTADGLITFYADSSECDFHIDALPEYSPRIMRALLEILRRLGLELMDDDECEPEILPNGAVRLYLTPIIHNPPHKELILKGRILLPITLPDLVERIPATLEVAAC